MHEITQEERDALHNTEAGFYLKLVKIPMGRDKGHEKKLARYRTEQTKAVNEIYSSLVTRLHNHLPAINLPDEWQVWRVKK